MLKALLRYFSNTHSEKMIEQLADSYLMRRLAQMTASVYFRGKAIAEEAKEERLKDINTEKFRSFIDKFQANVKEEIEKAKADLESKSKKQ